MTTNQRLALLLPALAAVSAATRVGAQNPIRNPGFESARDGVPDVWGLARPPGAAFALDETAPHSGKQSARVTGMDPAKQTRFVQAWRQNVLLPRQGVLWLTGWYRAEKLGNGRVAVLHRDEKGEVLLNQGLGSPKGTFDWRGFAFRLKRVEGATSVQLVLGLQKSTGSIWFDDLALETREKADYGTAEIRLEGSPVADTTVPLHATFTLGKSALGPGGRLVLQWDNWRTSREFRLQNVRAQCSVAGVDLSPRQIPRKKSWPPVRQPIAWEVALNGPAPLPAGTEVVLSGRLKLSRNSNVKAGLLAAVAPAENGTLERLCAPLGLQARGGPAARLVCTAEARPVVRTPGRLTVAVTDRFGNPAAASRATVRFASLPGSDLPDAYAFTEADAGSHAFAVTCPAGVVSRVTVTCGEWSVTSNPILPREPGEPGIYFGDIHSHCEISGDGVGDPDLAYDYARRFHGLDFAALSDHSPRGERWRRAVVVANRHNEPERFVTLLGFEWSSGPIGHRNAYYPGDAGPEQPRVKNNMQAWWDWLAERDEKAIIVPHHTNTQAAQILASGRPAWEPADWSVINHRYQRVVEICQNRGSFEAPGGPITELRIKRKDVGASVQTALALGHRLAFIGSTDTHSGRPGSGSARAAVVTADYTRRGIWQAMHDRDCYATTGPHALVFFTVSGRPMGRELEVEAGAARAIAWRIVGTGPIKRVDVLRNNEVVRSWPGEGKDDLSGEYTRAERLRGTEWWYVRAIQEDTHLAWSSPVWLDPR